MAKDIKTINFEILTSAFLWRCDVLNPRVNIADGHISC